MAARRKAIRSKLIVLLLASASLLALSRLLRTEERPAAQATAKPPEEWLTHPRQPEVIGDLKLIQAEFAQYKTLYGRYPERWTALEASLSDRTPGRLGALLRLESGELWSDSGEFQYIIEFADNTRYCVIASRRDGTIDSILLSRWGEPQRLVSWSDLFWLEESDRLLKSKP